MPLLRSRRDLRIDRALSSVLDAIERRKERILDEIGDPSWREIGEVDSLMHSERIKAYDRADKLHAIWYARVDAELENDND